MSVVANLRAITDNVKQATKAVNDLTAAWKNMGTAAGSASQRGSGGGIVNPAGGMMRLGGGSSIMPNPATFSTNIMNTPGLGGTLMLGVAGQAIGGMGKALGGVAAGFMGAIPGTADVMSRAAGYYGATMYSGMSRRAIEARTASSLGRYGMTSPLQAAAAANILTQGYGYSASSLGYSQMMGDIGGANRMFNMSNTAAAAAIGGMQTGSMGGNLYQYGIRTWNSQKGRPSSMGEISSQLFTMLYAGRKPTAEQIRNDERSLGNLTRMGFSEDQKTLLLNGMIAKAQGKNPNLAMASGNLPGNKNPMLEAYGMAGSENALMSRAEAPMIEGFNKAATAVQTLNKAMEGLPDTVFQFKAALETFLDSRVGKSAAGGAGAAMSGLGDIVGAGVDAALLYKLLGKSGTGAAIKEAGGLLRSGAKSMGRVGKAGAAGLAGGLVGLGAEEGSWRSKAGSALSWGGMGLMLGGGPGSPLGWGLAAIGATAGAFMGGGESGFGASVPSTSGSSGGFSASAPVEGRITATFGQKGGMWKSSHHGQDYAVPVGTPVRAAADGIVSDEQGGSAYGTHIFIDHEGGYQTLYGHLSEKRVSAGTPVKKGQVIGLSGESGNVTGPHLHFEVRKGKNNPVDPSAFLSGSAPSLGESAGAASSGVVDSSSAASVVMSGSISDKYSLVGVMGTYNLASALGNTASTTSSEGPSSIQSSSSGSSGYAEAPGDQTSWAKSFLTKLGVPVTDANITAITTWMRFEGGHWKNSANFNPLNTTFKMDGSHGMSAKNQRVQAYGSWDQGMSATIATLTGNSAGSRGYTAIIEALKAGNSTSAVLDAINNSAWRSGKTGDPGYNFPTGGGSAGFGGSLPSASRSGGGNTNTVTINVYPANASEAEAEKFAKRVKRYLDEDSALSMMGSM